MPDDMKISNDGIIPIGKILYESSNVLMAIRCPSVLVNKTNKKR